MRLIAPALTWLAADIEPSGGWEGQVPLWPFDRPEPPGLPLLTGGPLTVRVTCGHAFPMVEPEFYPLNVDLPAAAFGWATWHVAPDGALCLLQESVAWDPRATAADLIPKVSGWFLEYHLLTRGLIEQMTVSGIAIDDSFDRLLAEAALSCA